MIQNPKKKCLLDSVESDGKFRLNLNITNAYEIRKIIQIVRINEIFQFSIFCSFPACFNLSFS
jgi:hypothetical protein